MIENENDILDIHYEIQKYLNNLLKNKDQYESELVNNIKEFSIESLPYGVDLDEYKSVQQIYKDLIEKYSKSNSGKNIDKTKKRILSYKDWKQLLENIENFNKIIDVMDIQLPFFLSSVEEIVNQYVEEIQKPVSSTFMGYKNSSFCNKVEKLYNEYIEKGKDILGTNEFYSIIKKQPKIEIQSISKICSTTNMFNANQNENLNYFNENGENDEEFKIQFDDIGRVNMNQKYKYERKIHFRDTLQQFQGTQNKQISDKVYQDLENCIKIHSLIDEKFTDKRKFNNVTKQHIRTFLNECGYKCHYEDTQLIYSKLTGKPSPNISKYESDLYKDFDDLVNAYLQLPEEVRKNRKNFLNNQYVLKQLLNRRNIKVIDLDLSCLKTPSRLREHDEIYGMCCEILKWKFKPLA